MSSNSVRRRSVRWLMISRPAARAAAALVVGVAASPGLWLRTEKILDQFEHAGRPDVLREIRSARVQYAGDLGPPDGGRMSTGDQVERVIGKRQRWLVGCGHDNHTARVQQRRRLGDIRRPRLGGNHGARKQLRLTQNLATTGLNVQSSGRGLQPTRSSAADNPTKAALRWPAHRARRSPTPPPAPTLLHRPAPRKSVPCGITMPATAPDHECINRGQIMALALVDAQTPMARDSLGPLIFGVLGVTAVRDFECAAT